MKKMFLIFCLVISFQIDAQFTKKDSYVISDTFGQLGGIMFQVATASALAWDHNTEAYFPSLALSPMLTKHFFSKCKFVPPSNNVEFVWEEPEFTYCAIPFHNKIRIRGFFQSYKYFHHQRNRLLELFAPSQSDIEYIKKNYDWILSHPNTVGVQLKFFKTDDPISEFQCQNLKEYLNESMKYFSDDTLFVISSNDIEQAKKSLSECTKNIVYLENERFYIEFFLLTLCKHNIISNSNFGWWAAWLNKNPDKIVIRPNDWINGYPTDEICPSEWIAVYF